MSEESRESITGLFIREELRPPVGPDFDQHPPLDPDVSHAHLRGKSFELMGQTLREHLASTEGADGQPLWRKRLVRNPEVIWSSLDDEVVLLDLERDVHYTLNRVGAVVWELCNGDHPLNEILGSLCERYEVAEARARTDVASLVAMLQRRGLLAERG